MANWSTWRDYQHKLNLVFHAIAALIVLPFFYLFLEYQKNGFPASNLFLSISLFITAASFLWWAFNIKKKGLTTIQKKPLRESMNKYYKIQVNIYLILGAISLVAILIFYFFDGWMPVIICLATLFILSFQRPTVERISRELKLPKKERELLMDNEPIP